jgi:hypothetical protein
MTVLRVKEKLQSHVGSSVPAMRLTLRDASGAPVAALDDDARPLGYYSPRDGFTLHVVDTDAGSASAAGWLEDVSKVAKFELSDEAYEARDNTYRKFAAEQRKADPSWTLQKELARRRGVRALSPAHLALRGVHLFGCVCVCCASGRAGADTRHARRSFRCRTRRRRFRRLLRRQGRSTRRSWPPPSPSARAARCSRAASAAP